MFEILHPFQHLSARYWLMVIPLMTGIFLVLGGVFFLVRDSNTALAVSQEEQVNQEIGVSKMIMVDVSGAVVRPGTYSLESGARLSSAIESAGGFSDQASADFISLELNLASILTDEAKIYIPTAKEYQSKKSHLLDDQAGSLVESNSSKVSLNSSSATQLESLVGVGEKRAQSIIENRPYTSIGDLVEKGVLTQKIIDDNLESIEL